MSEYQALKNRLARGWNTWNTRSMLSHVLLPDGLAMQLGVKEYRDGAYLRPNFVTNNGEHEEQVRPGLRTDDGRYTELEVRWRDVAMRIESATDGDDLLLLITPLEIAGHSVTPLIVAEIGLLWNRAGALRRDGEVLIGVMPEREVRIFATGCTVDEPYIPTDNPYLAVRLDGPVGFATGHARTAEEIRDGIAANRRAHEASSQRFGALAEVYTAMQTCLAWDTIYDPRHDRVISPVSRYWNTKYWGGYVLFEWDTYFAAYMFSLYNKDLAYANAIEITREITESGFLPNYAAATGLKSRDRSQPPVGALMVYELYRRFGDIWLLAEVFDNLLTWNRWWVTHRASALDGLLAWGSDPYQPVVGNLWETNGVHARFGAALESGLDNSPMYDDIAFDPEQHQLLLADVGLNALYIADCEALAQIADALGKANAASELRERAAVYRAKLQSLWKDDMGLFLNRHAESGAFSPRISPTNFYPLIGGSATPEQAQRMIDAHFYNPAEFWGEWILPSIARNDPAYPDQTYWRGRIWAPMNFLVYLGLREYPALAQARTDLAEKSAALLLQEWQAHGHVHENYSGDDGWGCPDPHSDSFYHWGGLLGAIALMEAGYGTPQT